MTNLAKVANNASLNMLRYILLIFVSLITSIILARQLGTDGLGAYAVVLSMVTLSVSMTNTGTGNSITYYVSRNQQSLKDVVQHVFGLSIVVATVATSIAIITLFFKDILYNAIPLGLLISGITMIPVIILTNNFASIFVGQEKFFHNNVLQLATQLGTLVLTVVLVGIVPLGTYGGVISVGLGNLCGLIAAIGLILYQTEVKYLCPTFDWDYIRDVMTYGLKVQLGFIAIILNYRIDVFILNILTNTTYVGIYTQAVQIGEQMWLLSRAVASAMMPRIAALEGFDDERSHITSIISRYVLWLNLAISIVLFFISEPAIVLLYGAEFRASGTTLKFLLPGLVMAGTSRIIGSDIGGRGRPEINGIHALIAAIINIILNFILIPSYGFIGSAIATTISYTVLYILKLFAFRHLTGTSICKMIFLYRDDLLRIYRAMRMIYRSIAKRQKAE
ncbi:MAG: oligosaccharide flippase family protein [Chloroflexota bacterium]